MVSNLEKAVIFGAAARDTWLFDDFAPTAQAGPSVTLNGAATARPTFAPPETGEYVFGLTVGDGCRTSLQSQVTIEVTTGVSPIITCPPDIALNTTPGNCSVTVNVGSASATDSCAQTVPVAGVRSDGRPLTDPYLKGQTTITWTATDVGGQTFTCFTVPKSQGK